MIVECRESTWICPAFPKCASFLYVYKSSHLISIGVPLTHSLTFSLSLCLCPPLSKLQLPNRLLLSYLFSIWLSFVSFRCIIIPSPIWSTQSWFVSTEKTIDGILSNTRDLRLETQYSRLETLQSGFVKCACLVVPPTNKYGGDNQCTVYNLEEL